MQLLSSSIHLTSQGPNVSKAASGERIVFALGAESREHLLPHFLPDAYPAAEFEWLDLAALDEVAWEEFLFRAKPTVLVTGWGTPVLPNGYVRSPEEPLRYICHLAGSVRQIVPRALIERGVRVSNWGASISGSVAEHALLLVLGALRNLSAWSGFMSHWPRLATPLYLPLETRSLRGKRVGLHGFGSIARELARILRPFDVKLAGYSRGVPPGLFERHSVRPCGSLQELFSGSDILIECEALTSHSRGTVDAPVLRCLPDGAIFINVGRGQVVDENALIQVAREKRLRLGLDVYQEEPLPAGSPLRDLPDTLLSPHVAGPAKDAFADLCKFALANLLRHVNGEEIEAEVTLEIYDRST